MKVVLKESVISKILKARADADRQYRKVDYVVITPEEYDEVRHMMPGFMSYGFASFDHTKIVARDFESRTKNLNGLGQRYRSMCYGQIDGCDIYVAPEEFHPA